MPLLQNALKKVLLLRNVKCFLRHVKTLRLEIVYWCLNGTKVCIYMIREPIYR